VEALLAGTVLVEDLDAARTAAADPAGLFRIVTGSGEVLGVEGGVAGGRGDGAGHGMVARSAEIKTLRGRLTNEEKRLSVLQKDLREAEDRADEARTRQADAREALRRLEETAAVAKATAGRLAAEAARAAEEVRVLRGEECEIVEGLNRCLRESAFLDGEQEEVALQESRIEGLRVAAQETEARAEDSRRGAETRRGEARVEVARANERREAATQRRDAAERSLQDGERSLRLAQVEVENCRARREESLRTASTARAEAEIAHGRREKAIRDLSRAREQAEEAGRGLDDARQGVAVLDGEFRGYRGSLEQFRLKESESRMRLEGLLERMREEVRVDLAALHTARKSAPAFVEESPAAPPVDPPAAAPFDPGTVEAEIQDLRVKMERMGNVNLEALDQLGSVETETSALRTQEQDLTKAREELIEALKLLNKQSRERFTETFETIRGCFNETFRRLFGGGRADVYLAEGEDVLDAGVEIVARPPGKELRSISLLSGGERTMTAVALLFAIYQARPSPFCILDEVDAALDETNVGRFTGMVREFLDRSQFIMITHNKRTMTMCDRLYGISMAEPGVSSRVLLEMDKVAAKEDAEAVEAA
jgi:chromosome segregation protein